MGAPHQIRVDGRPRTVGGNTKATEPADLDALGAALRLATRDALAGVTRAELLYSGGLDSSLVAWLVPREVELTLVTVAAEGAKDGPAASEGARLLDRPLRLLPVGPSEVEAALQRWNTEVESLREPARSVFISFATALSGTETGRVLCGQGADELFFGYRHFRGLAPEEALGRRTADWRTLVDTEWPRALRAARSLGRDVRSPFLAEEVGRIARTLPVPSGDGPEPAKACLRAAAVRLGLPRELAERPKRALQYGSGIERLVRRLPRAGGDPGGGSAG